MLNSRWSDKEKKELVKFFDSSWTPMTLYKRINKINPNRSYEAVMRAIRRYKSEKGYSQKCKDALKKLRIGYLDIEATNLNASFGFMLSWYIKKDGKDEYDWGLITKEEIFNLTFDKRILKKLLKALDHYDILYTHYGIDGRFDIPFIRTRAFVHNMEDLLPDYMEKIILDTYMIARRKLRLHSNRLDVIATTLGIKNISKTRLEPIIWTKASAGDMESLLYIKKHNKIDVKLLEKIHHKLRKIERPIYRSM